MPQLVAVSPDILFGQFFGECRRHNAEMTPALHFAQRLSGRSWDAILSNAFVNYVYNVLTLQYPTISRQVGLRTTLHVPPETLKFECNFLVKQDLSGRICNVISSNVFVNDTYNDLTLQDQPISRQTGLRTTLQVPAEVPRFECNVTRTGLWPYRVVSVMQFDQMSS